MIACAFLFRSLFDFSTILMERKLESWEFSSQASEEEGVFVAFNVHKKAVVLNFDF